MDGRVAKGLGKAVVQFEEAIFRIAITGIDRGDHCLAEGETDLLAHGIVRTDVVERGKAAVPVGGLAHVPEDLVAANHCVALVRSRRSAVAMPGVDGFFAGAAGAADWADRSRAAKTRSEVRQMRPSKGLLSMMCVGCNGAKAGRSSPGARPGQLRAPPGFQPGRETLQHCTRSSGRDQLCSDGEQRFAAC